MGNIFESSLPEEEYLREINGLKHDLSMAHDLINDLYDAFCIMEEDYEKSCPYTELSIKTNEFLDEING